MRNRFLLYGLVLIIITTGLAYFTWVSFWIPFFIIVLYFIGIVNTFQKKHTILRNFPVLGYFRYFFESISPEIQQYFIERYTDGRPFSRNQRSLAYRRAKNVMDTQPFGTLLDLKNDAYEGIEHSIYALNKHGDAPRIKVGGKDCKKPYEASILNISAMSFGALSSRAIVALNRGAKRGNFYHNTGEGGLSEYHLEGGGDIVWQIGTAYFGCRTEDGNFDPKQFEEKAKKDVVKMIELKISQGAKPGHGGVLPAVKNTPEIARNRGIEPHTTVLSPPGHKTFNDARGLLDFIVQLRELSGGKPTGFKLCIGIPEEFDELCSEMKKTGILPDFITVDGAEGGTGAAPPEFSDSVGYPLEPGLLFVNQTLKKYDLRDKLTIIASGKILSAASLIKTLAMGADMCNSARGFMFSLGCIQALRCNTNHCPTGVTTQNKMLMRGLNVADKSERVYYFHKNTLETVMEIMAAAGKKSLSSLNYTTIIDGNIFKEIEDKYLSGDVISS